MLRNTLQKLKTFLLVLGALLLFPALFHAYLAIGFAEESDIHPYSPFAWLLIDPALRQIEPIAQCSPRRYSRTFQECGGICGEYRGIWFGTTATEEDLRAAYDLEKIRAEMGFDGIDLSLHRTWPGADPACPIVSIRAYDDFATDG